MNKHTEKPPSLVVIIRRLGLFGKEGIHASCLALAKTWLLGNTALYLYCFTSRPPSYFPLIYIPHSVTTVEGVSVVFWAVAAAAEES